MSVYVLVKPPTVENAKSLLVSRFFDPKRYDLANVGSLQDQQEVTHFKNRLFNQRLAETLVDPETYGCEIFSAGRKEQS